MAKLGKLVSVIQKEGNNTSGHILQVKIIEVHANMLIQIVPSFVR